jgi:hypothetical protein
VRGRATHIGIDAIPIQVQSTSRVAACAGPPFSDAAGGEYPLVSTRGGDDGIDFATILHHDEVCDHRRPTVGEVDGEGAGAVRVHRVSAVGRSVGEVGDYLTVDRYRVDLSKRPLAIKSSHRHTDLKTGGSRAYQFVALDGESIVAGNEFVIAGRRVALRVS